MLRSLKELIGYDIQETDDVLGQCDDFIFDDGLWVIRYMVADTGNWLKHHKVLISPVSLGEPDWRTGQLAVNLSREQIENCPPLEAHAPISREYEVNFHEYFELPFYWVGARLMEGRPDANGIVKPIDDIKLEQDDAAADKGKADALDGILRSAVEIMGYDVFAADGDIGRVDDIIIEDDSWVIRYLAIDTGKLLPGKKVLINTEWIDTVSWEETQVKIDLTQSAIEACPDYDADAPVNREYEVHLYDYHGRPRYWE